MCYDGGIWTTRTMVWNECVFLPLSKNGLCSVRRRQCDGWSCLSCRVLARPLFSYGSYVLRDDSAGESVTDISTTGPGETREGKGYGARRVFRIGEEGKMEWKCLESSRCFGECIT